MTDRLRTTRETCGLSLAQAAKLLGWAQGPLHAMEIGAVPPTGDDLKALAMLYGCSVAWLRGETAAISEENRALLRTVESHSDRMLARESQGAETPRKPFVERRCVPIALCSNKACLASCDLAIIDGTAWLHVESGWLCPEHRPF